MSNSCLDTTPLSAFLSTDLNSKINDFGRLGDRISRALGAPMVNVEIHQDQLFENISIACEMFTKYCGYTEEFIVFSSSLYERGKGIRMDQLFSISPQFRKVIQPATDVVYVANTQINSTVFTTSTTLSATYSSGIFKNQILTSTDYLSAVNFNSALSANFSPSQPTLPPQLENCFDYDIMDYRKVIDVIDFEEGSTTGTNTLFTIEQTLAQQTYFSYAMGNYGFDLVSWYILKDWLKNREKLLAQKRYVTFDPRTQYLNITPEPTPGIRFWGILQCYVERPLRDIIKEQWVYQYALALSKISVGSVRGKYSGTVLFGGGQINANMLEQGYMDRDKLEEKLYSGASAGLGDSGPPKFFVG